jgi:hypothetical protein
MAPYDHPRQPDDDQEGHLSVQPSLSASVPEEGSPLRNGTVRPNIARQRSSSTQLTRPKLPAWQQGSNARNKNYTILGEDGLEAWDRSHSGSPPPRLSLEGGYSSRSSASPAQPSDSTTSPDPELAPRKSFKRSITVPTRPRIPGMWAEAPMSNSIGGIAESEVRANTVAFLGKLIVVTNLGGTRPEQVYIEHRSQTVRHSGRHQANLASEHGSSLALYVHISRRG